MSHNTPSFALQDKINCKLHNNLLSPCLISQPGRPWDILIFVDGGAFQYGTSSKELFKLSLLSLFCSLILLNSFQSVTEITNCKITINLEKSFFFLAFVYIQILFSVSSWDGNQMMSENHIVQKLFCLIHVCIDTMTKERIKNVPANYIVKRSNKSAVSSLDHLHIFLFFSNRPVKSLLVHPFIQKGAICVTLNAIFKTIRHEIQVEI